MAALATGGAGGTGCRGCGVMLPTGGSETIWFLADITELKRYQESCELMAHIDALTGLPNRVLLADRMDQALALAQRHHYDTAVCYIDLDGFKAVNDRLGHAAGDQLLTAISRRLERAIRDNDTAARLGGDEFVLLLTHVEGRAHIENVLQRVLVDIAAPIVLDDGTSVRVTASIGISVAPADGGNGPELLRRADAAMYVAKAQGRGRLHYYCAPAAPAINSIH